MVDGWLSIRRPGRAWRDLQHQAEIAGYTVTFKVHDGRSDDYGYFIPVFRVKLDLPDGSTEYVDLNAGRGRGDDLAHAIAEELGWHL